MHIGNRIEQVFREQGRSPSWLAQRLNMVRVNVYDIFRRPSVDTELLRRISVLLDYDFFAELSSELSESTTTDLTVDKVKNEN